MGVNTSNGSKLTTNITSNMAVFYSFPSTYETLLPDNVEYTIYTLE